MQDMSDEEIDHLFRQAASNRDASDTQQSKLSDKGWHAVKKRIESEPETTSGYFTLRAITLAGISLLGLVFLIKKSIDPPAKEQVAQHNSTSVEQSLALKQTDSTASADTSATTSSYKPMETLPTGDSMIEKNQPDAHSGELHNNQSPTNSDLSDTTLDYNTAAKERSIVHSDQAKTQATSLNKSRTNKTTNVVHNGQASSKALSDLNKSEKQQQHASVSKSNTPNQGDDHIPDGSAQGNRVEHRSKERSAVVSDQKKKEDLPDINMNAKEQDHATAITEYNPQNRPLGIADEKKNQHVQHSNTEQKENNGTAKPKTLSLAKKQDEQPVMTESENRSMANANRPSIDQHTDSLSSPQFVQEETSVSVATDSTARLMNPSALAGEKKSNEEVASVADSAAADKSSAAKPQEDVVLPVLQKTRGFSVGLLYSPDISFTQSRQFYSLGTNLGVRVEYSFSKRLAVSTGFIYSKKLYRTDGSEYHLPDYATGAGKLEIDNVKANCLVFDIPLTVKYNFLIRDKFNVSVSAGLSSYILKSEEYKYDASYQGGNWYEISFRQAKGNKYFFSVTNLSIAYERKLNQRFSLRAEPFIKLPLGGIGYGKVKIISSGLFVSLNYTFK